MSVLFIGQSTYDMIMSTPGRIIENQKKRATSRIQMIGGPATCACGVCSKWGIKSYLLSRVGDDFIGDGLISELKKYRIDTAYVKRLENANSAFSTVVLHEDNGNRTIFNDAGDLREVEFDVPSDVKILEFDGHEVEACKKALKNNPDAISVLDGGSVRKETLTLAKLVDYLVCSNDFANQYYEKELDINDMDDVKKCFVKLHELCDNVVITVGEHGAFFEEDDQIRHIEGFKVEVRDTTGAGDVFHGAFVYGLYNNLSLSDTVRLACAASALSITHVGGIASIPTIEEAKELIKRNS